MTIYHLANPLLHDTPASQGIHELQRALQAAKIYHGPIDGIFGQGTGQCCKQAKWQLGYPRSAVARTGGPTLLSYLTGAKHLPPAFTARRHARGFGLTHNMKVREAIVAYCRWGIEHEPQIHYAQRRPIPLHAPYALPMYTDCSGFATLAYKVAGAPDPNGNKYNGQGYTGTLLDQGTSIPLYQAEPGDLIIWGNNPGHHVAVIIDVTDRLDPLCASHGREAGPNEVTVGAETAAQKRLYTVKRFVGV